MAGTPAGNDKGTRLAAPTRQLEVAAEALAERSARIKHQIAAVYGPAGAGSLLRVISDIFESQHADGSWGSDDAPRLKPALTAQTIVLLWWLGIRYVVRIGGERANLGPANAILSAVRWLESVQRIDGSWGEDAWDTCHVLEALGYCGYTADEIPVRRALDLVRSFVDHDWPDNSSYWYGPGFIGAAMLIFNVYGDPDYARRALDSVWKYWDNSQHCFLAPRENGSSQRAPAEWHTACVILGLRSFGSVSPRPDQVELAFAWLIGRQTDAGCWSPGHLEISCYTTKQVVAALATSGYETNRHAADRGTTWFLEQCTSDGPLIVKLMAGFVVARTRAEELVTEVSFHFVTETTDLLDQYRAVTDSLIKQCADVAEHMDKSLATARLQKDRLEEELGRYAVKLTERQLAVWGVLLTVVTFVIGLVIAIVLR